MIDRIIRAYVRRYSGQTTAYVEWLDENGENGRTEGDVGRCKCCGAERVSVMVQGRKMQMGAHMAALFERAEREGVTPERERR